MADVPRAASLPLGILLVGGGGILLFTAFHNLPANITSFSDYVGWLAADIKGTAKNLPSGLGTGGEAKGGQGKGLVGFAQGLLSGITEALRFLPGFPPMPGQGGLP
jgi:hypothetical protein